MELDTIFIDLTLDELSAIVSFLDDNPNVEANPVLASAYNKLSNLSELEEEIQNLISEAPYRLSDNQEQFVRDCVRLDLTIDWHYSGRGMMGRQCPSVVLSSGVLKTLADIQYDNLGLDTVFYARY